MRIGHVTLTTSTGITHSADCSPDVTDKELVDYWLNKPFNIGSEMKPNVVVFTKYKFEVYSYN